MTHRSASSIAVTTDPPIRIALVGRQPVVAAGLHQLLQCETGFEVVCEELIPAVSPAFFAPEGWSPDIDVTIFDIDGGAEGFLPEFSSSVAPTTRTMILGCALTEDIVSLAFRHGVTGAVQKHETPEVLSEAIRVVHSGHVWLDRSATTQLVAGLSAANRPSFPEPVTTTLTPREREVVGLVGKGMRNIEIARHLSIAEVTVRNHLTSIFRKLELSNRFQLAHHTFKHGLRGAVEPATGTSPAAVAKPHR